MPLQIVRNDIVRMQVDAIVNAANERLAHGGGVCGAIFAAAGPAKLQAACDAIGHCDTGSAVATPGFALPARHVIHAVGPVWHGGAYGEEEALRSCYRSALTLARDLGDRSIAFPLISSGIYGYPKGPAVDVALSEIRAFLDTHEMDVYLTIFDADAVRESLGRFSNIAEYIDDKYVDQSPFRRRFSNVPSLFRRRRESEATSSEDMTPPEETFGGYAGKPLRDSGWHAGAPEEDLGGHASLSPEDTGWFAGVPEGDFGGHAPSPEEDALAVDYEEDVLEEMTPLEPMAPMSAPDSAALRPEGAVPTAAPRRGDVAPAMMSPLMGAAPAAKPKSEEGGRKSFLSRLLKHLDAGFSDTLMRMIDERGMKDSEVYKRANMSRQHFSKIRSNPDYRPKKQTVLALAIALGLTLDETRLLLERAGFALTHADERDVIVEYFIENHLYDIYEINLALYTFDQPLLG